MNNLNNNTYITYLENCNINTVPEFEFNNAITKIVKVIDVYDGDTITVAMCIHPSDCVTELVYKFKVRMYGYNTEELRQPKNEPDREEKKEWAIYQRDWVKGHLLNKIVYMECLGNDKYGRLLGKIFFDKEKTKCLNDMIVSQGVAPRYVP